MFNKTSVLNKNILITGSSKGLGQALGKRIITDGKLQEKYQHLIIHGSSKDSLTNGLLTMNKLKEKNIKITGIVIDFDKPELNQIEEYEINDNEISLLKNHKNLKDFFKESMLDEIILNHAISKDSLIYNIKKQDVQSTFNVNIISYIDLTSNLLNVWFKENLRKKQDKKIITIGSILNDQRINIKGNMVYAMTKKNVEMLSEYIKLEYSKRYPWLKTEHYNIPFLIDTNLVANKQLLNEVGVDKDSVDNVSRRIFQQ